jgi:hypothetical protein
MMFPEQILRSVTFWSFAALLIAPLLLSLLDFVILARTRFVKPVKHIPQTPKFNDFTILIPIFGKISYLKNTQFLKKYASQVVLCTTTHETDQFNADIQKVADTYGFKIFRSEVQMSVRTQKPNPWNIFKNTLSEGTAGKTELVQETVRDEIIKESFQVVNSEYSVFIDGDTTAKDDLAKIVGVMAEKDYDLASVRVVAANRETLIEKLQAIEYELAMDARKIYPWLTSGAGMVAKTEVVRNIMTHHSLFFSGGDIEIGKLATMMGYKVGHLSVEFYTDIPHTFRAWFCQRVAWCGGDFRHEIMNLPGQSWHYPLFFLYNTVVVYLLTPIRWMEILYHPEILLLVILLYWILIGAFHLRRLHWYYLLFPLYSLFQVMIILPLGVVAYFGMVRRSRNIGLIKLRNPNYSFAFEV